MMFLSSVAALRLMVVASLSSMVSANVNVAAPTNNAVVMPLPQGEAVEQRRSLQTADWTTLFADNLDDSKHNPANWSVGRVDKSWRAHSGAYTLAFSRATNTIELKTNIAASAAKYDLVKIDFFFKTWGLQNADDSIQLEVSKDGGASWIAGVKQWVNTRDFVNKQWIDASIILDGNLAAYQSDAEALATQTNSAPAGLTDKFRFRFKMTGITTWTEFVHLDDFVISAIETPPDFSGDESLNGRGEFCPVGRKEISVENKIWSDADSYGYSAVTDEISYIVQSTQTYGTSFHDVAWVGADGDQDSISAVDLTTGDAICTYELEFNTASQQGDGNWESMSMGPCDSTADSKMCLYLGNTGNNDAEYCHVGGNCADARSVVEVYKVQEPNINEDCPSFNTPPLKVATIQIDYTHSNMPMDRCDSDALFVDFTGDSTSSGKAGDIYLVTKNKSEGEVSRVVKVPVSAHAWIPYGGITQSPFKAIPEASPGGNTWTGADMSSDGKLITLRDFDWVFFYSRGPDQSVGDAIAAGPCPFASKTHTVSRSQEDFETVALNGSNQMLEVSECYNEGCHVEVSKYDLLTAKDEVGDWKDISKEAFDFSKPGAKLWTIPSSGAAIASSNPASYVITAAKSVELTDDDATTMTKSFVNVNYDQLRVKFSYFLDNFDSTDQEFYLEMSVNNGAHWKKIKYWQYNRGVVNGRYYENEEVIIDRENNVLRSSYATMFRFRLDAFDANASNKKYLYIDNVAVQGRKLAKYEEPPTSADPLDEEAVMNLHCPVARQVALPYVIPSIGPITDEISYFAHSSQKFNDQNVVWMGSDGDWSTITAAVLETGQEICTWTLKLHADAGTNGNWESMTLGACDSSANSKTCLYMGNTGNSDAEDCDSRICLKDYYDGNRVLEIYKLHEPDVSDCRPWFHKRVSTIQFDFSHPDMPTDHGDVDAIFLDHTGDSSSSDANKGDIYMMTKNTVNGDLLSRVVKIPVAAHAQLTGNHAEGDIIDEPFPVIPVATPERGLTWEGADMSADGSLITARDFDHVYFYPRPSWKSVADVLAGPACPFSSITKQDHDDREQYESVAFLSLGGVDFVTEVSECDEPGCSPTMCKYQLLKNSDVTVSDWKVLSFEDFEDSTSAWDTFTGLLEDGKDPVSLSTERSTSGNKSLLMKHYSKTNLKGLISAKYVNQLRIMFNFFMEDFEDASEDFYLEVSNTIDGDDWVEVKEWNFQRGVTGDKWYMNEAVIIDSATLPLTTTMRFRFVSDSSSLGDYLYLDDISISSRKVETIGAPLSSPDAGSAQYDSWVAAGGMGTGTPSDSALYPDEPADGGADPYYVGPEPGFARRLLR